MLQSVNFFSHTELYAFSYKVMFKPHTSLKRNLGKTANNVPITWILLKKKFAWKMSEVSDILYEMCEIIAYKKEMTMMMMMMTL